MVGRQPSEASVTGSFRADISGRETSIHLDFGIPSRRTKTKNIGNRDTICHIRTGTDASDFEVGLVRFGAIYDSKTDVWPNDVWSE